MNASAALEVRLIYVERRSEEGSAGRGPTRGDGSAAYLCENCSGMLGEGVRERRFSHITTMAGAGGSLHILKGTIVISVRIGIRFPGTAVWGALGHAHVHTRNLPIGVGKVLLKRLIHS